MDTKLFNQQVSDLTGTLGDATRRGIYVSVRESRQSVTAAEIAPLFQIHPNVARHHLDRLVEDGYLQVTHKRRSGRRGPGAGRPAKHYEPTEKEVSIQFPERRHDLLAELLVRVVEELAPDGAGQIAEKVGRAYGRELAAQIGLPDDSGFQTAAQAVARAMMGVGFDTQARPGERMLVTTHCPFGTTAASHPEVVCRLDQGIVKGLLEGVSQEPVAIVNPHQRLEDDCITEL